LAPQPEQIGLGQELPSQRLGVPMKQAFDVVEKVHVDPCAPPRRVVLGRPCDEPVRLTERADQPHQRLG
jgi:hypothetical protein